MILVVHWGRLATYGHENHQRPPHGPLRACVANPESILILVE